LRGVEVPSLMSGASIVAKAVAGVTCRPRHTTAHRLVAGEQDDWPSLARLRQRKRVAQAGGGIHGARLAPLQPLAQQPGRAELRFDPYGRITELLIIDCANYVTHNQH